ncbi:SH3 domain-containing protein [Martelella sp. HB161492]|uniref:SH3 domain-containing protein n=1 Tax=Martelella sp. HB161492 TaxID=2720726 RepID=UPI0015903CF0|nr:SH3 domain-containing protein [Martelella sp. HB161492]
MKAISRLISALLCALILAAALTSAQAQTSQRRGASGEPLPRFAVLKPDRARMRVGPGFNYATKWIYTRPGLPVEIIEEYSTWRQIRDADGTEGWMHVSVLSSKRNAMVAPWLRGSADKQFLDVKASDNDNARNVASLEAGVIVSLKSCDGKWCELEKQGVKGFMHQNDLWGAYPGEVFH